ncbi:DUF5994 family protein [Actinokineospora auranticolor]|uniref:Uncharacterized protein n=1 Tax=Actinokineospora auranticolor TaxID=155976 RepID=A0A2S6GIL4_9PSEU|nr:DUF5994 family protein [Actinokineospora auranticolor]PPK65072.1 hypothetical protein CLV40_116115 [Actinokineospora auranticolor]
MTSGPRLSDDPLSATGHPHRRFPAADQRHRVARWGSTPTPCGDLPVRSEVRLRLKPRQLARGVDGAWWPRSPQPLLEVPELVLAMSSWVGPVSRVTYHVDDWDATEGGAVVDGWPVELVGSDAVEPHTVSVTGTHQRGRCLLVVPPWTPETTARTILRSAARPGAVTDVEQVLTEHGVLPRLP